MESCLSKITCLLFKDNLVFLVASNSFIEIKKLLEKARKITFDWGTHNAITYDINKIEAILFLKARK